ncbi:MAG: putative cinnamoyl ester hydrolase [Anaerocolumna sp.]|nr:putative cinnamoyl ester hydrolase [Anaerocolumna sp.]
MTTFKKQIIYIKHHERTLYGISYLPENIEKCPIVIFSHGFNGNSTNFEQNSEYLASKGIATFCFDFCGGSVNSKSDLKTTEMTLFTEKEDLCAVIKTIKTWENIDNENIFLFGASQGGVISALVAEELKEDIKGLLLLFPAFCIPDDWNKRFPTIDSIPDIYDLWGVSLGRVFFEIIHDYDIFEHIGNYNKNVIIFHGDQDGIVPLEYGIKAANLYRNSFIEVFPEEGHGFSETGNIRVLEMTYDFVQSNI